MKFDNLQAESCPEALRPQAGAQPVSDCSKETTTPPASRCPDGTYYDPNLRRCLEIPDDSCPEPAEKLDGYHWDPIQCQWVKDSTGGDGGGDDGGGDGGGLECPDGMHEENGVCVDDPPVMIRHLEIRPAFVVMKPFQSVQFKVFLVGSAGNEEELTSGLIFTIDDYSLGVVGGSSGKLTALDKAGITTIVAESTVYDLAPVMAQVQIVEACADQNVGMVLLLDNSKSCAQAFGTMTKLQAGKNVAVDFIQKLIPTVGSLPARFYIGSGGFADSVSNLNLVQATATSLLAVPQMINAVAPTQSKTNISGAVAAAIAKINTLANINRRVVLVLSDGQQTLSGSGQAAVNAFKEEGGIVIAIGLRACDRAENKGFSFLQQLATPGFFLNAFPPDSASNSYSLTRTKDFLAKLKGYFCAGDCSPAGGSTVFLPCLQYFGFKQWEVVGGHVDLIGDGGIPIFDLVPGNGLYVDMVGSGDADASNKTTGWKGTLRSKGPLVCKADGSGLLAKNTTYRVKFKVAGNQRHDTGTEPWKLEGRYRTGTGTAVPAESTVGREVVVTDWLQGFEEYTFEFTTPANPSQDQNYWLEFAMTVQPDDPEVTSFGLLLDDIRVVPVVNGVEGASVFTDTFDSENQVTLPPCSSVTPWGYGYGYGYGYGGYGPGTDPCTRTGCIATPPPEQLSDPSPLAFDSED